MLPLHHDPEMLVGRMRFNRACSMLVLLVSSGSPESRTRVAALRVRCPGPWTTSALFSVGPEGLEPSLGGLRVRCAAASTLIPCVVLSVGAEGIEPSAGSL